MIFPIPADHEPPKRDQLPGTGVICFLLGSLSGFVSGVLITLLVQVLT